MKHGVIRFCYSHVSRKERKGSRVHLPFSDRRVVSHLRASGPLQSFGNWHIQCQLDYLRRPELAADSCDEIGSGIICKTSRGSEQSFSTYLSARLGALAGDGLSAQLLPTSSTALTIQRFNASGALYARRALGVFRLGVFWDLGFAAPWFFEAPLPTHWMRSKQCSDLKSHNLLEDSA